MDLLRLPTNPVGALGIVVAAESQSLVGVQVQIAVAGFLGVQVQIPEGLVVAVGFLGVVGSNLYHHQESGRLMKIRLTHVTCRRQPFLQRLLRQ